MKLFRAIFVQWTLVILAVLALHACEKHCEQYKRVEVNFLDDSHTVVITGEDGQGTFTLTPETPAMNLPATGTYSVCINFTGGCPARIIGADSGDNIVGGAITLGMYCTSGLALESGYIVESQCE